MHKDIWNHVWKKCFFFCRSMCAYIGYIASAHVLIYLYLQEYYDEPFGVNVLIVWWLAQCAAKKINAREKPLRSINNSFVVSSLCFSLSFSRGASIARSFSLDIFIFIYKYVYISLLKWIVPVNIWTNKCVLFYLFR